MNVETQTKNVISNTDLFCDNDADCFSKELKLPATVSPFEVKRKCVYISSSTNKVCAIVKEKDNKQSSRDTVSSYCIIATLMFTLATFVFLLYVYFKFIPIKNSELNYTDN